MKEFFLTAGISALLGLAIGYIIFNKKCNPCPECPEQVKTEICFEYRDTCLQVFPPTFNPKPVNQHIEGTVTEFTYEVAPFKIPIEKEEWKGWNWEEDNSIEGETEVKEKELNTYELKSENDFGTIYSRIQTEGVLISWQPYFKLNEPLRVDPVITYTPPMVQQYKSKPNRFTFFAGSQFDDNDLLSPVIGLRFSRPKWSVDYANLLDGKTHQITAGYNINF